MLYNNTVEKALAFGGSGDSSRGAGLLRKESMDAMGEVSEMIKRGDVDEMIKAFDEVISQHPDVEINPQAIDDLIEDIQLEEAGSLSPRSPLKKRRDPNKSPSSQKGSQGSADGPLPDTERTILAGSQANIIDKVGFLMLKKILPTYDESAPSGGRGKRGTLDSSKPLPVGLHFSKMYKES